MKNLHPNATAFSERIVTTNDQAGAKGTTRWQCSGQPSTTVPI